MSKDGKGIHFEDYRAIANAAHVAREHDGTGIVKLVEVASIDGDVVAKVRILGSNEADLGIEDVRRLHNQLCDILVKRG